MFGAIQGFGGAVRVLSISLNIGISGATGAAFGGLVGGVLNAGVAVFTSPIVESIKRSVADSFLEQIRTVGKNHCDQL